MQDFGSKSHILSVLVATGWFCTPMEPTAPRPREQVPTTRCVTFIYINDPKSIWALGHLQA